MNKYMDGWIIWMDKCMEGWTENLMNVWKNHLTDRMHG